jgi:hypothetical protein
MTEPSKNEALIAQLHAEIVKIWRLMALTAGDDETNRRLDELAEMTRCLAQAPARTLCELEIKISVLCARLREEKHPEVRGEVLTWMLADSIRHDCHLIAPVRGQSAGQ